MANILDMIIAAKGGSPNPAEGSDGEGLGPDLDAESLSDSGSDAEGEHSSDAEAGGSEEGGGTGARTRGAMRPARLAAQGRCRRWCSRRR